MEYVTLGKTGLRISRVGLGGIPIQHSEADPASLMTAVRDAGINYIDSARGYTVSEERIGKAIEGFRDHFVIATKSMARDKESMARDIDLSLKNFRTDHIELYQVHNPNPEQLEKVCAPGGALEALLEAKAAGKIQHIGVTAHSTETFEKALELSWVETIMFPYNIVENQGADLMARAHERNIGFICMKPMAGGALEDGRLAMRYVTANPDVTVVIPGMKNAREVLENVSAAEDNSPFTEEEKASIETIRRTLGTEFCRRCGYCAPCSAGIPIPNVFTFHAYLNRYGLSEWAKDRYASLPAHAGDCVDCGLCETRCPYELPIRKMLKKASQDFGY